MSPKSFLSTDIFAQLFRKKDAAQFHFNGATTNCPQCAMEYVYETRREQGRRQLMCQNCGHSYWVPLTEIRDDAQMSACA